jgi:putative hydrolase of HD superfamily
VSDLSTSSKIHVNDRLNSIVAFLTDIERLKLVERRALVSNLSRRENSAEHSWHLAIGLLTVARDLGVSLDLHKALIMSLIHDICEIDAGDTPAYGTTRPDQHEAEQQCVDRLSGHNCTFASELRDLWEEYEAQVTTESRWVKVLDRFTPFVVNLACGGANWREQNVSRSQLLRVNEPVRLHAPEIYDWMLHRIEQCVRDGWLRDE